MHALDILSTPKSSIAFTAHTDVYQFMTSIDMYNMLFDLKLLAIIWARILAPNGSCTINIGQFWRHTIILPIYSSSHMQWRYNISQKSVFF